MGDGTLKWKHKLLFNVIKHDTKMFADLYFIYIDLYSIFI